MWTRSLSIYIYIWYGIINWCEYKRLRYSTNAAVKRAKESYHKSLVEEHSKDNPKAFLRTIKKLLPDPDKNPSTALRINDEVITCPKTFANKFNSFFTSVARLISQSFSSNQISFSNNNSRLINMNGVPTFSFCN